MKCGEVTLHHQRAQYFLLVTGPPCSQVCPNNVLGEEQEWREEGCIEVDFEVGGIEMRLRLICLDYVSRVSRRQR